MVFDADSGSDLIVLLFFVVIAVALAARILAWNYVKGFLASGWSMTQGRVEFGSVEERHIRYITYYVARIDYSYSHEGPNDLHPIASQPPGKVGPSAA